MTGYARDIFPYVAKATNIPSETVDDLEELRTMCNIDHKKYKEYFDSNAIKYANVNKQFIYFIEIC